MTSIQIGPDDAATRSAQVDNKKPAVTGPVQPVKPARPVQISEPGQRLQPVQHQPHACIRWQRRHEDRRKVDIPVLLDTRSYHDRRTHSQHSPDTEKTLHGIDKKV